jgi:outer membrane translocation and assembly module TamA
LGGENGLRGYSVRQFAGDNSLLVTLENRRAVLYDWLRLVSLGWAAFADAGTVWNRHTSLDTRDIRSDVGIGLRLAPTRSVDPGLLRIDVAYALNGNQQPSRFVLNIGADIHFGDRRQRKFDQ